MTVARHYRMDAAEGKAEELRSGLAALADTLKAVPGFEGAELLRDVDQPHRFVFIEKWASVQAHKDGGAHLPKDTLAPVMAALAGRPEAAYLEYLIS